MWYFDCQHLADAQSNGLLVGDGAFDAATTGTNYTISTVADVKSARMANTTGLMLLSRAFGVARRKVVGFMFYPVAATTAGTVGIVSFWTGATIQLNLAQHASNGLVIRRGTTVLETIGAAWADSVWRYVELAVDSHPTAGAWYLWVDGVLVASATGVDTGTADVDSVAFGSGGGSSNRCARWYLKDWEDENTPAPHGPLAFHWLPLTSDESNADWVPDTGSVLYSRITPTYPGAGYIDTTVLGAKATFGIDDLPPGVNSIVAVVPVSVSEAPAGGAPLIACGIETTAGEVMGTSRATGTASPRSQSFPLLTKPGGGAWSTAAVAEAKLVLEAVS